jgi:hypothetical protein
MGQCRKKGIFIQVKKNKKRTFFPGQLLKKMYKEKNGAKPLDFIPEIPLQQ